MERALPTYQTSQSQEGTRPGPSGSTVSGAERLQCGAGCSLVFSEVR